LTICLCILSAELTKTAFFGDFAHWAVATSFKREGWLCFDDNKSQIRL